MSATNRAGLDDYDQIKSQLLTRRSELEERLGRIKSDMSTPLDQDFAEQAVELENGEVLAQLGREAEDEIGKINRALIRIEEGIYTECSECGREIALQRLKAQPYTALCIDCANQRERH